MKGICFLSAIPMRSEPSDKAEIINQALHGESFDVLQQEEKWSKIRLHHDRYEGWIDNKQWKIFSKKTASYRTSNTVNVSFLKLKTIIYPAGSYVDFKIKPCKKSLLQTAKSFLNTPYLWGGRTFMGIDCSGFTQIVFRIHCINLLRDACQQASQGKKIALRNATNNDLAFFHNTSGKIIHVGIVMQEKNSLKIIHAAGKVRIDTLDTKGIWNAETQSYSHMLHSIKRVIK